MTNQTSEDSAAAAAPTSPIVLLLESVRDETQLTQEPPKPPGSAVGGATELVAKRQRDE